VLPDAGTIDAALQRPLQVILEHGPLARRMLGRVGREPNAVALVGLEEELADCLRRGEVFRA
jgi:hypothetical protein